MDLLRLIIVAPNWNGWRDAIAADYPTAAWRPAFSALSDRHLELEHLKTMRPWEDALDDCLLRYHEVLQHE